MQLGRRNVGEMNARIPISGEAVVVVFDMCSSSDVIEEVTLGGNVDRLKDFLTH
jgi:hypothetical protein